MGQGYEMQCPCGSTRLQTSGQRLITVQIKKKFESVRKPHPTVSSLRFWPHIS